MATARLLARQMPDGTAYVIGEGGLLTAVHENGDAIVVKLIDCPEGIKLVRRSGHPVLVGSGRNIHLCQ